MNCVLCISFESCRDFPMIAHGEIRERGAVGQIACTPQPVCAGSDHIGGFLTRLELLRVETIDNSSLDPKQARGGR
jgi:hypothetical protein